MRSSAQSTGVPSEPQTVSSVSSGRVMVQTPTSVMPHTATSWVPSRARASVTAFGGIGAPPQVKKRSDDRSAPGWRAAAVQASRTNVVVPIVHVTRSSSMSRSMVSGSQASCRTSFMPYLSGMHMPYR